MDDASEALLRRVQYLGVKLIQVDAALEALRDNLYTERKRDPLLDLQELTDRTPVSYIFVPDYGLTEILRAALPLKLAAALAGGRATCQIAEV